MKTSIHSKIKKYTSAKKPKSKTFKEPWKPNKSFSKSKTRKKQPYNKYDGFYNTLSTSIQNAKKDANTHYEKAKVDAFKQINDEKNKVATEAQGQLNKMKTTAIKTANKVKYSSPKNLMLAKAAELTMKETQPKLNQLQTDSSHFYNKTFGKQKALLAAKISDKGVPQSNPEVVGPNLLATTMHRK